MPELNKKYPKIKKSRYSAVMYVAQGLPWLQRLENIGSDLLCISGNSIETF